MRNKHYDKEVLMKLGFHFNVSKDGKEYAIKNYDLHGWYYVIVRPDEDYKPFLNIPPFEADDNLEDFKKEFSRIVKEYKKDIREIYR